MTQQSKFTPGLKVARIIMHGLPKIVTEYGIKTEEGLADLINRQTKAPEMYELLGRLCDREYVDLCWEARRIKAEIDGEGS